MHTLTIPNTIYHQRLIKQIREMIKLEHIDSVRINEVVNWHGQSSAIEFQAHGDSAHWERFMELAKAVRERRYSKLDYGEKL